MFKSQLKFIILLLVLFLPTVNLSAQFDHQPPSQGDNPFVSGPPKLQDCFRDALGRRHLTRFVITSVPPLCRKNLLSETVLRKLWFCSLIREKYSLGATTIQKNGSWMMQAGGRKGLVIKRRVRKRINLS